eukprot:1354219-Amorphochlora_amoeboformis.AAC.1
MSSVGSALLEFRIALVRSAWVPECLDSGVLGFRSTWVPVCLGSGRITELDALKFEMTRVNADAASATKRS